MQNALNRRACHARPLTRTCACAGMLMELKVRNGTGRNSYVYWKLTTVPHAGGCVFEFSTTSRHMEIFDLLVHVGEAPAGGKHPPCVEFDGTLVVTFPGSRCDALRAFVTASATVLSHGNALEQGFVPQVAHSGAIAVRAPCSAARVIVE